MTWRRGDSFSLSGDISASASKSKSESKRVYLQSALGHINASGRGKAILRRSQAVFKCLQWWGIDSFRAEGIPVKHSTSEKWIFGSVMTRPDSSNFFYCGRAAWAYGIARPPHQPPVILSGTPELEWAPLTCSFWQINSILANIGHRNSIRILNQYPSWWNILVRA